MFRRPDCLTAPFVAGAYAPCMNLDDGSELFAAIAIMRAWLQQH